MILATDGDFNVGITSQDELKGYIERERGKGVFLSVLGFGMGNYNDALMQTLAQNGNGTAAYIDTLSEARKDAGRRGHLDAVPGRQGREDPGRVQPGNGRRDTGWSARRRGCSRRGDFDNDKVDAGDVGSGQTVTALYEIVPVGGPRAIGDLRYSRPRAVAAGRQQPPSTAS